MEKNESIIPLERIAHSIFIIRGQKVLLDNDLALLYGVSTKQFNRAVQRNLGRFPADFMFQLTPEETKRLRCQIGTSNKRGGRRYLAYAFTEQGVAMLSSVLRSKRAILVNIEIMRTFTRLRQILATNKDLAEKLAGLEEKYDKQLDIIFEALRRLMDPGRSLHKGPMGFQPS